MGVRNQPFLVSGLWQAQVSYQYGYAYQFYIGDERNDQAARFPGFPPQRKVNLFNLDVAYGLSNRLTLDLTVPFSSGSGAVMMGTPDSHRYYEFRAGGLGDVSLSGEYWLSDPREASRVQGSVGLGFNAPTGSDTVKGTVYAPGGDQQQPMDELDRRAVRVCLA